MNSSFGLSGLFCNATGKNIYPVLILIILTKLGNFNRKSLRWSFVKHSTIDLASLSISFELKL